MRNVAILSSITALASTVVGHATFQELWINGKDQAGTCARLPVSNSPVTDVTSGDIRCNAKPSAAASTCPVAPGDTVTIEMHQQAGDRSCANEAIGGAHYGPVQVYLSKVDDAASADGSTPWYKIFQDTWGKNPSGSGGSDDYWGTKDLNTNCGKMDLKIPADTAPGDYLLRAEAIALHAASGLNGAQFYVTCYQITVSGSGSSTPAGVSLPGAYKATDPGIQINIYQNLATYVAPGPSVVPGGVVAVAGKVGSIATVPAGGATQPTSPAQATSSAVVAAPTAPAAAPTTLKTSVSKPTATAAPPSSCTAAKYAQCGGTGFSGCTTCAAGSTCKASGSYYSQCL